MKKMIYGRAMGLVLILVGLIFSLLAYYMIIDTGRILVMLFSAPILFFWGLAFMLFPGSNQTLEEVNGNHGFGELMKDANLRSERQARQLKVITEAPKSHKVAWGISLAIGAAITLFLVLQMGI